jgi:hypothetical protein
MLRYRDICERPTQVLDLTSLLPNELALIVPAHAYQGKKVTK